jgi:hypothetical protein
MASTTPNRNNEQARPVTTYVILCLIAALGIFFFRIAFLPEEHQSAHQVLQTISNLGANDFTVKFDHVPPEDRSVLRPVFAELDDV